MEDFQPLLLAGHRHPVYALFAPRDLPVLYSAGADQVLVQWKPSQSADGTVIARTDASIYAFLLDDDSPVAWIATSAGRVHIVDTGLGRHISTLDTGEPVFDLRHLPSRRHIMASTARGTVAWFDTENMTEVQRMVYCDGKIRKMASHPSEPLMALACADGMIRMISPVNGELLYLWQAHTDAVTSLAWLSESLLLSGGKDAHLKCWDRTRAYTEIHDIAAHNYAVYGMEPHPARKIFATCSRDKTAKIWDAESLQLLQRLGPPVVKGHTHSVNALCWLHHDGGLATAGDDGKILVWNKYM